eukprot:gene5909-33480_t
MSVTVELKSGKLSDVWSAIKDASGSTVIDLGGRTYGGSVTGLLVRQAAGTRSFVTRYLLIDKAGLEMRNGTLDLGQRYRLLVEAPGVSFSNIIITGEGLAHCQLIADAPLVHVTGVTTTATFSGCCIRNEAPTTATHAMLVDLGAVCTMKMGQVEHSRSCGVKVQGGTFKAFHLVFNGLHTNLLAFPAPASSSTSEPGPSPAPTKSDGYNGGDDPNPEVGGTSSRCSTVELEDCHATAKVAAGPVVEVSGGGTRLSALRSHFDGGNVGILVSKTAVAELIQCDVMNTCLVGVWASCGQVSASSCNLHDNKVAIMAERAGRMELTTCTFEENAPTSVLARGSGCIIRLVDCSINDTELLQGDDAIIFREDGIAEAISMPA